MSINLFKKTARLQGIANSRLPIRHQSATMNALLNHAQWSQCKEMLGQILDGNGIAILIGPRGTGKTQLGVMAGLNLIENTLHAGYATAVRYYKARELGMEVRDSFSTKEREESKSFKQFIRPQLLIIDEVKERLGTEFEQRVLTSIIDERYDAMKSTIMITNAEPGDLPGLLGPSIMDRCREGGGVIVMDWATFRGT